MHHVQVIHDDEVASLRLANVLAQQKARFLLDHAEDNLLGDEPAVEEEPAADDGATDDSRCKGGYVAQPR